MVHSAIVRRSVAAVLALTSFVVVGCEGGKPAGSVTGTVKYKGAPLSEGDVNFIGKNGAAAIAKIDASGGFKIDGALEADEYRVYFSSPPPEPAAPGTRPARPKADLPAKFKDPASSGVVVPIKSGKNDVTIEFKD